MRRKLAAIFVIALLLLFAGGVSRPAGGPDLGFLSNEAKENFQNAKFAPLGPPPEPADNPATPAKVALGKALYFDPRLSADGTVSCASCHDPAKAWADAEKTALGIHNQRGLRNSPTVLDSAYYKKLFWDSRASSLEEQALGPVQNPVEMGNTPADMAATLARIGGYREMFHEAFGSDEITADRVARALAAFERTVVTRPSPWDRFLAGDNSALTAAQKRGLEVFLNQGGCTMCHNAPFLTTQMRLAGIRVPTLRNVAITAPYFSDGAAATLADAIRKRGPKDLTDAQVRDLEALLNAFTGQLPDIRPPAKLPR